MGQHALGELDWRARNVELICALPTGVITKVLDRVNALLSWQARTFFRIAVASVRA
ncbi:MAG: hypothetical protein AB1714_25195 [Acidobacteriota bacterium]